MADDGHLISVIIPVFNGEAFLYEAVSSVESQGVPVEIIVVDDGSTDDTERLCGQLSDRIKYHRQPNRGPSAARNAGIEMAASQILAFQDVDDVWMEGALAGLLAGLESDSAPDVVLGKIQLMVKPEGSPEYQMYGPPFHSYSLGTGLYRRAVFDRVGRFDVSLRQGEDVDWFLRAREAHVRVELLDSLVLAYRRHGGNMTFGEQGEGATLLRMLRRSLNRRREAGIGDLDNHRRG